MSKADKGALPANRRLLFSLAAAGIAVWWIWPHLAPHFVGSFEFEPMKDPPGFRRIDGGQVSGFPSPLLGLDTPPAVDLSAEEKAARADVCTALFGGPPAPGVVPIASFSDYNCPYCRVLTEKLTSIADRADGRVEITWHEWPLLGPTSDFAAKAALAADLQNGYLDFHKRLMRTRLIPTETYLTEFAVETGADPAQLLADMDGPEVAARLRNTRAVARILGLVGTPSLVIGRTVVVGAVSEAFITALIEQERQDGPLRGC